MERKSREMLLVGIALAVMAGLFVWPATRWLIRLQLVSQLVPSGRGYAAAERRIAEGHPQDFQIQYVHALTDPTPNPKPQGNEAWALPAVPPSMLMPSNMKVERLRFLEAQFSKEPALYAHILRYATMTQVHMRRREQDELTLFPEKHIESNVDEMHSEYLAAFDRDAAQGERLDPDNAYFPLVRAAGLYEAGRDADAIAAIHRAGQKTRYEDYSCEEFVSLDRYYTLAHGESGAIARAALAAGIVFPQYTELRAVSRMGVVSAIHMEQRGDTYAGLSMRCDLAQCGALMREQGHTLICNLVGVAITAITVSRPGGSPLLKVKDSNKWTPAQWEQERVNKYYSYLHSIKHDDMARWIAREMDAGKRVKSLGSKLGDVGATSMNAMFACGTWWLVNLFTLTNAIGLLLLSAAAAIAAQISPGKRLLLWRVVFTLGVVMVFALWLFNVERVADWISRPLQMTQHLTGINSGDAYTDSADSVPRILVGGLALMLPLIMIGGSGIVSACMRVPLATGIGRDLRTFALPAACVLFLLYAGLLMGTLRQEVSLNAGLQANVHSEGEAVAAAVNRAWPGPTR